MPENVGLGGSTDRIDLFVGREATPQPLMKLGIHTVGQQYVTILRRSDALTSIALNSVPGWKRNNHIAGGMYLAPGSKHMQGDAEFDYRRTDGRVLYGLAGTVVWR